MRQDYDQATLDQHDLATSWLEQFLGWLEDANSNGTVEPNAMVLATADADGRPSGRTVLLKDVDERGFVFFTNLRSPKARDVTVNPRASLIFPWLACQRQVVVVGTVTSIEPRHADDYFATRPYGSRIGAWASAQSNVIPDRSVLDHARAEAEERFPVGTDVPKPESWGGFRVAPETIEFWQGRRDRLHDRFRYRVDSQDRWTVDRLSP